MYYSENLGTTLNQMGDNKPVKLIYADGTRTGNSDRVDFEDWDDVADSRTVHFLWPDGTELTTAEMSKLDDYVFTMPTGDPQLQVMYSNMSDTGTLLIGAVILQNP